MWLEQGVRDAFNEYVEHEEHMRAKLIEFGRTGRPLRDWKRAFFLDQSLRPTRRQVLSVAYSRGNHGERWVSPSRPHELSEAVDHNNAVIRRFVSQLTLMPDDGDAQRTVYQRHMVVQGCPLRAAYEQLLEALRLPSPDDSLQHTALLLQISTWLESHPNATCSVYLMSPDASDRRRTRTKDDDLGNFYQGANPTYPGDREIRHATDLTIQIHALDLHPHLEAADQAVYRGVSLVATRVPLEIGRDWLVQ